MQRLLSRAVWYVAAATRVVRLSPWPDWTRPPVTAAAAA